ncbi:hypothetical protein [Sphaerimonospora thailandensis]|uniref:Uncharacterized protein n=1 Tax=Sphaerimonospora thailandensis TaxID=795644 RepID=A0A8J3RAG8_9ACTN|nr:hypothetical protein [Sphaerimonospora thailandensis]GIH70344.1 hypothetical protein Mth01_25970 [Sphaerimonospora thailandensis]
MPITRVQVRHKESGATAEISPAALRYFPDYELVEPDGAPAPAAPAGAPPEPARPSTAPRPRRAANADKE